jgi:hypothetical protein
LLSEALATQLDVPVAELEDRIVYHKPQLPDSVLHALEEAETERTEADSATPRAAEAKAAEAAASGWTVRGRDDDVVGNSPRTRPPSSLIWGVSL